MITMNYRPYHLPQISAPYTIMVQKFDEENIPYDMIEVNPEDLNPSQGITFSDEVGKVDLNDLNPIYIDNEMNVLDGHHRYIKSEMNKVPLKAIQIKLNNKDACRLLNKIQDIYEYEQSHQLEEVEMQGAINYYGDDENQFLTSMDEQNEELQGEKPSKNEQTIIAFRKDPIKENSVVGNFFTLKPIDGYSKYEIDFDNLLDTEALGVVLKDSQQPVDILSKIWFPNVNFEELSNIQDISSINLKCKAVAEKAMKMGYDGIKYGDTIIQGLK